MFCKRFEAALGKLEDVLVLIGECFGVDWRMFWGRLEDPCFGKKLGNVLVKEDD